MNTLLMSKLHRCKGALKQQQNYLLHQGTVHTNAALLTSVFTAETTVNERYTSTNIFQDTCI